METSLTGPCKRFFSVRVFTLFTLFDLFGLFDLFDLFGLFGLFGLRPCRRAGRCQWRLQD
ncbi:hypothetical protein ABZV31_14640 [Streptomyces sp. NPDC005202]|uniref:hypothetical protein n=1 Tax=Streptomyces sp. NPDC005202 TaxID=3157021 RepID=UPI0033BC5684